MGLNDRLGLGVDCPDPRTSYYSTRPKGSSVTTTRSLASGKTAIVGDDGKVLRIVPAVRPGHDTPPPNRAPYGSDDNPYYEGKCYQCDGSGLFHMGGGTVNGRYTGKTGPCFRCEGKGHVTAADEKRNTYYDNHIRRIYL